MTAASQHPVVLAFDNLLALRRYAGDQSARRGGQVCDILRCESHAFLSWLLQDLFGIFFLNGKKDGFFVEFDASDGVMLSNTLLLERRLVTPIARSRPIR